ncbi:hypothetical protein HQ35_10305 [Porphyromonas cangingivalis]|uniref:Uncharacterized protein n=1 Tax=Porphyromonas cangingivalis TaxID=36874 RepID=A0A0A2EH83_PORCN|nr:hypothetical protein HQ35_10305 [Porphyromonas cangingivalis]
MRKQIRKKAGTKPSTTKIDTGAEYPIHSYKTRTIQATHQDGKNNTKKSLDLISKVVKLDDESR